MSFSFHTDNPFIVFGVLIVMLLITIIPLWKIYEKAGYPGWSSIIPFYNNYILSKITMGNGWLFLLLLIPCVGIIFSFVMLWNLCKKFNKGTGFFIGMIFFPIIFYYILAFGSAEFIGNNKVSSNSGFNGQYDNSQYFDEDRYKR